MVSRFIKFYIANIVLWFGGVFVLLGIDILSQGGSATLDGMIANNYIMIFGIFVWNMILFVDIMKLRHHDIDNLFDVIEELSELVKNNGREEDN